MLCSADDGYYAKTAVQRFSIYFSWHNMVSLVCVLHLQYIIIIHVS